MKFHLKKENGYIKDVIIDTHDITYDDFVGYKTSFIDDAGIEFKVLYHKELRARIDWVDGYFTAYRELFPKLQQLPKF